MNFLKKHWKKGLGLIVGIVGAFTPAAAVLIPVGTLLIGTDFQVGASAGTPVGRAAKEAQRSLPKARVL